MKTPVLDCITTDLVLSRWGAHFTGSVKTRQQTARSSPRSRVMRWAFTSLIFIFTAHLAAPQSTDLVNWSRQNNALTPIAGTMISSSNIVERPKGKSRRNLHDLNGTDERSHLQREQSRIRHVVP